MYFVDPRLGSRNLVAAMKKGGQSAALLAFWAVQCILLQINSLESGMVSNKNDIITFLQTHKDEMAQRFGVVSVGLFGSYARGEAREDSDIDIAIEIRSEKKSLGNFLGIRRYLEQQLGKTVDLGIESTLKPLAREMVAKEIIHV